MDYVIRVYDCLCELSEFTIGGIEADYNDFGDKYDADPESAEPYGCGNMRFFRKPSTEEVLVKYKITTDEYNIIADELEEKLSFGNCGWCV